MIWDKVSRILRRQACGSKQEENSVRIESTSNVDCRDGL